MNFPTSGHAKTRDDADGDAMKLTKHRLQNDLLILDGDLKKQIRLREGTYADIRRDSVAIRRMEVAVDEKKHSLEKAEREIMLLEDRIKKTKRALNAVS